jgi:hypothetical protein
MKSGADVTDSAGACYDLSDKSAWSWMSLPLAQKRAYLGEIWEAGDTEESEKGSAANEARTAPEVMTLLRMLRNQGVSVEGLIHTLHGQPTSGEA